MERYKSSRNKIKILYVISISALNSPSTRVRAEIFKNSFKYDKEYSATYFYLYSTILDKIIFKFKKNRFTKYFSLPFVFFNFLIKKIKILWLFATLNNYSGIIIVKYFDLKILTKIKSIFRGKILFDFDDAIWLDNFGGLDPFIDLVTKVDYVSCDNTYLLDKSKNYCNKTFIVNGPAQVNYNTSKHSNKSKIIIGWIGSQYTLFYLNLIVDVIEELSLLYNNIEFRICGIGRNYDKLPKFRNIKFSTLAYYDNKTMIKEISNFDIGVYPIDESELSLGRGSLKATLYMSCGIPVVASAIGHNCNIIKNGFNGFLANSKNEWFESLNNLILNEHLRKNIGKNGFNFVRNEYSIENCYSQLRNNFLIDIK